MFINGAPWAQQHSFNTTQSGDITGTWAAGVAMPGTRGYHATVFIKGYVWLIGGMSVLNTYRQSSYRGTVDSSGVITSWTTVSNFPFNRAHMGVVVVGGYVYIIGGLDSGTASATILRATINSSGVVGTFSTYSVSLPYGRSGHKCAVIKDKVYVFGGDGTNNSDVLVSNIYEAGELDVFTVAGTITPYPYQTLAVTSSKVYLIGGSSGISYPTAIQGATINADGTLGTFSTDFSLNSAIGYSCELVSAANIHTFGGRQANTTYLSALNRILLTNGVITSQDVVDYYLLAARYGHSVIATSSRAYVMGGVNSSGTFQSSTEYVAYTGGLNDYSSKLEILDPTSYILGPSACSNSSSTTSVGYSVVTAISLASGVSSTSVTAECAPSLHRILSSSIQASTQTSALTKVWSLSSSALASCTTSTPIGTPLTALSSTCANDSTSSIVTATRRIAVSSTLGAVSVIALATAQRLLSTTSGLAAVSSIATVLKVALRSISSTLSATFSASVPGAHIQRLLTSAIIAQSSTAQLDTPGMALLVSAVSASSQSAIVSSALSRALVTFLAEHVNVPSISFQRQVQLQSIFSQFLSTSIFFVPSGQSLDPLKKYTMRSLQSVQVLQASKLFTLKILPSSLNVKTRPKYYIKKVTYGIIV